MKTSSLQQTKILPIKKPSSLRSSSDKRRNFNKKQRRVTFAVDNHEKCLRALRIANKHAAFFTTALTARILYKSGKFDDEALEKMLKNTARAMEIADKYCARAKKADMKLEKLKKLQKSSLASCGHEDSVQNMECTSTEDKVVCSSCA